MKALINHLHHMFFSFFDRNVSFKKKKQRRRQSLYETFWKKRFKFLFIHKTFFARVCFLMIHLAWQKFAREKWRHEVAKVLRGFILFLSWNLLRFQSRVKNPPRTIRIKECNFIFHWFLSCSQTYLWTRKIKE